MSTTQSRPALGSRENFWGEPDVDELADTPVSELSVRDLRRYVEHTTSHSVPVDRMDEPALRSYARRLRAGGHETQPSVTAQEIARWKAHQVLRERADKLSKSALHEPPNRQLAAAFACVFEHLEGVEPVRDHNPLAIHTERCEVELTDPELYVPKDHEGSIRHVEYGQHRYRRRYDPEHGYIGGVVLDDLPTAEFLEIVELVLGTIQERHHFREERIERWFGLAKRLKREPEMTDEDVLTALLTEVYQNRRMRETSSR